MNSAPWTEISRCQQDISSIKSELHRKADDHEIHSINRRLDSLEHSLREIGTALDGFLFRLQACEEQMTMFMVAQGGEER